MSTIHCARIIAKKRNGEKFVNEMTNCEPVTIHYLKDVRNSGKQSIYCMKKEFWAAEIKYNDRL